VKIVARRYLSMNKAAWLAPAEGRAAQNASVNQEDKGAPARQ
jgi:hypothetical protein